MRSPRELDLRSLRFHQLVAAKIRADPSLFMVTKSPLEHKLASASPSSLVYLVQWARIFDRGLEEALAIAVEDSEQGQVLRSASPFAGVLTQEERLGLLQAPEENCGDMPQLR